MLTASPTSISNTYPGSVTLQISGLTNGETVLIERFLDANGNGTVDVGELLVQSFKVTDGQVTAFRAMRTARPTAKSALSFTFPLPRNSGALRAVMCFAFPVRAAGSRRWCSP